MQIYFSFLKLLFYFYTELRCPCSYIFVSQYHIHSILLTWFMFEIVRNAKLWPILNKLLFFHWVSRNWQYGLMELAIMLSTAWDYVRDVFWFQIHNRAQIGDKCGVVYCLNICAWDIIIYTHIYQTVACLLWLMYLNLNCRNVQWLTKCLDTVRFLVNASGECLVIYC